MSQLQQLNQLQRFFIPIDPASIDHEKRVVRGTYKHKVLDGGGRFGLPATALKRAAAGYLAMPCLRSMDGKAAGKGLSVEFNAKGQPVFEAQIVDDNEWRKVVAGVYRFFEIGGRPKLVRGGSIDQFDWIETLLVDRPSAPISRLARGERSCLCLERRAPAGSIEALEAARDAAKTAAQAEPDQIRRGALVVEWMRLNQQIAAL